MDIDLLSNMVKELILDHDSVALAGFGTFVAINMPASFSDRGYTINPPYRKLNFLLGDHPSDGLLVDLYASSNSIEKSDSESILRKFFFNLKDILLQEKILVFPGIGAIKMSRNDVCIFVPDSDLDISPDFYGLSPLSLKSSVKVTNSHPIVLAASGKTPEDDCQPEQMAGTQIPDSPVAETMNPVAPSAAAEPVTLAEPDEPEATEEVEESVRSLRWWLLPVILLILVVVLLAAFLALAQFAPDIIDRLLYTEEQLLIINTDLENLL